MGTVSLQIGLLLLGLTCVFAWAKGNAGERAGSAAVAVAWVGSLAVQALVPQDASAIAFLVFDVALATALLVVAIRYSSWWLGAAMLLQAFVLALHGEELGENSLNVYYYVIILNVASAAMLLTIVASTIGAWIKQARGQREAPTTIAPPGAASAI